MKDRVRQDRLESLGVRFLRFSDEDVKQDLNNVLQVIRDWIRTHPDRIGRAPASHNGYNTD